MDGNDHLKLVAPLGGTSRSRRRTSGRLDLAPSAELTAFLEEAAAAGLHAAESARLALERALVLIDIAPLGFDLDAARHHLGIVAAGARPRRPLDVGQAAYIRALRFGRPLPPQRLARGLAIVVPERLLTRAHDVVWSTVFDASAVPEMVAWEIAATLEGRTMGEWALAVLAAARAAG